MPGSTSPLLPIGIENKDRKNQENKLVKSFFFIFEVSGKIKHPKTKIFDYTTIPSNIFCLIIGHSLKLQQTSNIFIV